MIADCDACNRKNVPCEPMSSPAGDGLFCHLCRDDEPDPYREIDIVDVLRMPWHDGFATHQPRQIDLDAADEIERLRAELIRRSPAGGDQTELPATNASMTRAQLHTFADGEITITVSTVSHSNGEYSAIEADNYDSPVGWGFSTIGAIADFFSRAPRAASEREERDRMADKWDHDRKLREDMT